MSQRGPVPSELRLEPGGRTLRVTFDAAAFALSAEFLRVHSPSAEVRGHGPGQATLVAGRREVAIVGIDPVGHYAVRLRFDDGHDTGLYSWAVLFDLGSRQEALWRDYLAALEAAGLTRHSAGSHV